MENINKSPQSFLEIIPVQKEVSSLYYIPAVCERSLDHSIDSDNFSVMGYLLLVRKDSVTCMRSIARIFKFPSHTARISGELDSRKDSHPTKFERRLQILVKRSFIELCDSKLSG